MNRTSTAAAALIATAALSIAAAPAEASDRVALDTSLLARVAKVDGGLEKIRVYLNRRLVVLREAPTGDVTQVDGEVQTIREGREQKDVILRSSAGKLIDAIVDESGFIHLWVSFDSDCNDRDCAWKFVNQLPDNQAFGLETIPTQDVEEMKISEMWFGRKPFFWRKLETRPDEVGMAGVYNTVNTVTEVHLQVNLDEVARIERLTVQHHGWDQ